MTNPVQCNHREVEYLHRNDRDGKTFMYRCEACNSLGVAVVHDYVFDRLVNAKEGDRYPVYVKRRREK